MTKEQIERFEYQGTKKLYSRNNQDLSYAEIDVYQDGNVTYEVNWKANEYRTITNDVISDWVKITQGS